MISASARSLTPLIPRSGSQTLSDLVALRLEVACEKCGRKGSYSVAKLFAERGDLRLTDFLSELTSSCPNARSIGWHERCPARFVW